MDRAGGPFQQCWTYGEAAAALGAGVIRVEVSDAGRTLALAQGVERWCLRPISLITMGPVWVGEVDDATRAAVLRRLRAELASVLIATAPDEANHAALQGAGLKNVMTPATLAILNLGPDLRANMHVKWRNRLSRAERSGLKVREACGHAPLDWLLQADRAQQKRRRYRALPAAFTRAWADHAPQSTMLLSIGAPDDPLAAMLFLTHGTSATYHIGWTNAEGRKASAHNLILAEAARRLSDRGVTRLNLGLLDTEGAPGLARFKLGSGAEPVRTGGTWLGW